MRESAAIKPTSTALWMLHILAQLALEVPAEEQPEAIGASTSNLVSYSDCTSL